jgi:tetratricopeptide (TPR) repeat protein
MVLGLMRRDRIAFALTVLVGVLICGPLRAVGQQASLFSPSPDTGDTANATVQKYLIKGTTEAQLGDYEEAILYFETALDRAPNTPILLEALADAHHAQGDEATALFYARKALSNSADRAYYHHRLAELQRQAGQPEAALQTYRDLVDRFPADTSVYRALAELQAMLDRPSAALDTYGRLLEYTSRAPVSVYRKMLSLHRRLGNLDGIERTLRALLNRRPNNPEYRRRLGNHYASTDRPGAALDLLAPLAKQRPDDTALQQRVNALYRRTGRTADARSSPPDSADLSTVSVDALVQRAASAYDEATAPSSGTDSTRLQAAETLLDRALDRAPTHVDALSLRARLLDEQGAPAQAAQVLERALEENPRVPDRWARAASAHLSAHDYDAATSVAEEGLLLFPGHTPLARTAAVAQLHSGAPKQALDHFQDALEQQDDPAPAPDDAAVLRAGMGLAHTHLDRPQDADDALERALTLAPDHPRVLRHYAYSLALRQTQLDRALELARRAVDRASSDPLAHDTLGWVYLQRDNPEAAQRHLQRALDADPPSARILEHAGDVEQALGNNDAAQSYWQQALDRSPDRFSLQQKLDRTSTP